MFEEGKGEGGMEWNCCFLSVVGGEELVRWDCGERLCVYVGGFKGEFG